MAQRVFQQCYHIPGTLAANVNIRFTGSGLCKECVALAFEESARVVRRMDEDSFKFV